VSGRIQGTVLVTGGSGFVGAAVVRRLLASKVPVVATSRRPGAHIPGARWVRADLRALEEARSAVLEARPSVVIHLAADVAGNRAVEDVHPMLDANLVATVNCLIAASEAGVGRFVYTGSLLGEPDTDAEPVPPTPYGAAKWAAAGYARMFNRLYGLPVVIVRPSMVYGPAQADLAKLVPYVVTTLLRDEAPQLMSGTRRIDLVYVDDVAEAVVAAGSAEGAAGRTIDIGSGVLTPVRDVVREAAEIVGGAAAPVFGALPDRPLESERAVDPAVAHAILGWSARVSLADGLRRTVDWYRAHPGGADAADRHP
jgi:nucleoside-diphosphate-sugar epimerase